MAISALAFRFVLSLSPSLSLRLLPEVWFLKGDGLGVLGQLRVLIFLATVAVCVGSEFSLLLFPTGVCLLLRALAPLSLPYTHLLSSLAVVYLLSPSSLPPPSSPTSAWLVPPLPPLLPLLSLSLYRVPHPSPLTCRLPTRLVASLRQLLLLLAYRLLLTSSPHPPFPLLPLRGRLLLPSYGPGCWCPASFWGYRLPGLLVCMRVLLPLPLPPPSGLPIPACSLTAFFSR